MVRSRQFLHRIESSCRRICFRVRPRASASAISVLLSFHGKVWPREQRYDMQKYVIRVARMCVSKCVRARGYGKASGNPIRATAPGGELTAREENDRPTKARI